MKLFHSRSTSYISLCIHNVVCSVLYYILTYFLEDISFTATLKISSINKVYVFII